MDQFWNAAWAAVGHLPDTIDDPSAWRGRLEAAYDDNYPGTSRTAEQGRHVGEAVRKALDDGERGPQRIVKLYF